MADQPSPVPPPDFHKLFEALPGLYLVVTPGDFRIAAVSDAYLRATLTARERILGRGLFEVFPDNPGDPAATGVFNLRASLERVVRDGVADTMAVQKYDIRRPDSQGGGFEERYWSPVNSPTFAADGRLAYIVHRVEDVTEFVRLRELGDERDKANEELRTHAGRMEAEVYHRAQQVQEATERLRAANERLASDERLRQLADAMPQIVWSARPDGFLDYYNRRWYEFTGRPEGGGDESWVPVLHPDDVKKSLDVWYASVKSGEPYQIEYRLLDRRAGEYRWHLGRALAVRDEAGKVARWYGTCTDIHDQRRAKEEAESANRAKDDFLAVLSHELRTPLTPVLAAVSYVEAQPDLPEELRSEITAIRRNVEMEARLIDDLLDLTRVSRGKVELHHEVVDAHAALRNCLENYQRDIEDKRVEVSLNLWARERHVWADPARLQQVFCNLVSNAVKFTPEGGRITLGTSDDGGGSTRPGERQRDRDRGRGPAPHLQGVRAGRAHRDPQVRRAGPGAGDRQGGRGHARRQPHGGERGQGPGGGVHAPARHRADARRAAADATAGRRTVPQGRAHLARRRPRRHAAGDGPAAAGVRLPGEDGELREGRPGDGRGQ